MSKKEKNEKSSQKKKVMPQIFAKQTQGIAGLNNKEVDIRNLVMDDINLNAVNISENEQDELLKNIMLPDRITINKKNGDTTVIFEDGRKKTYSMIDIVKIAVEQTEYHIRRYYSILGTYFSRYTFDEERAIQYDGGDEHERNRIDNLINGLYNGWKEDAAKESKSERRTGIMVLYHNLLCNDCVVAIYILEYIRKLYSNIIITKDLGKYIDNFEKLIKQATQELDEEGKKNSTLYGYINQLLGRKSDISMILQTVYNVNPLSDIEAARILTNILSKEEIKEYLQAYGAYLVDRKSFIKYLIEKRFITEEELKNLINKDDAYISYLVCENKELLKYIKVEKLVELYEEQKIDINTVVRHTSLKELLICGEISKEKKMQLLLSGKSDRVFTTTETAIIWELYEKDYFTLDEIKALEQAKYMHVDTVIKNYNKDKLRKIAAAVDVAPSITSDKIREFYTPDIILRELRAGMNGDKEVFYNNDLRAIYKEAGRDIEKEVVDTIFREHSDDKDSSYRECIDLHKKGFITVKILKTIGLPEDIAMEEYTTSKDTKMLVDYFNAGIVSQDTLIDILGDEFNKKIFELIGNGMSAKAIEGFYSTQELISMLKDDESQLTIDNLVDIKSDIKTGLENEPKKQKTLLDMYLNEELSYSELYDLQEAGIITKKEADEIDDKYSLEKSLEKLKSRGILGQPLCNLFGQQSTQGSLNQNQTTSSSSPAKKTVGLDSKHITEFYKKMGAKGTIEINAEKCPVFEGYVIVPIIDKKICFLEGVDGRTYIVPLKIILEQIIQEVKWI